MDGWMDAVGGDVEIGDQGEAWRFAEFIFFSNSF